MKLIYVDVGKERTYNLGDYNSAKVRINMRIDVEDVPLGQIGDVLEEAWSTCDQNIASQLSRYQRTDRAETEEYFMGLSTRFQEIAQAVGDTSETVFTFREDE